MPDQKARLMERTARENEAGREAGVRGCGWWGTNGRESEI